MSSDSVIVRIGASGRFGYGEAVVRDYVSGSFGTGADFRREAARVVARLVTPLRDRPLAWGEASGNLASAACDSRELPFLCAVETAVLDLACATTGRDVFSVLGMAPLRDTVRYSGVLPIFPAREAEKYLRYCLQLGLSSLKLKLNGDADFDSSVLSLAREILGPSFDIRTDANSSWKVEDGPKLFEVCRRHGVSIVEQPFHDGDAGAAQLTREARAEGFSIMADEGVLTSGDIRRLAEAGTYSAVNLRLSKNGGLSRLLALAGEAEKNGLSYQLGCMVGETGILSALGRVAAALLPSPLHIEGSYDDLLLTENITTANMSFGARGEAPVMRGRGLGCEVSPEKLERLSVARVPCL